MTVSNALINTLVYVVKELVFTYNSIQIYILLEA